MSKTPKEIREELDVKVESLIKEAREKRIFEKAEYVVNNKGIVIDYDVHIKGQNSQSGTNDRGYRINNNLIIQSYYYFNPTIEITLNSESVYSAQINKTGRQEELEINTYKPSRFLNELENEYKRVKKIVDEQQRWQNIKKEKIRDQELEKEINEISSRFEV